MADAEAAFLASMRAANDAAGNYEASGGASNQPAESNPDEYDPFQALQSVQSSANAQASPTRQTPSSAPLSSANLLSNSNVSLSSDTVLKLPEASDLGGHDEQSQSRSMSRASSSEVSSHPAVIVEANLGVHAAEHEEMRPSSMSVGGQPQEAQKEISVDTPDALLETNVATPFDPAELGQTRLVQDDTHGAVTDGGRNETSLPVSDEHPTAIKTTTDPNLAADGDKGGEISTSDDVPKSLNQPSKARLPHDIVGLLEDRIKEDERGDIEAWLELINEYRKKGKLDDARKIYERFFLVFPAAGEQWLAYAQMENDAQHRNGMEKVLQRTLFQIPYLPLWSLYLDHVKRLNNLTTDTSGGARSTIHQAYDLALQQVGLDKDSGKIWQDYIHFIKSGPGEAGKAGWLDQQKMDLLRKVYQRAVCIPTQSTTSIWKEYDGFERGLNKVTGQKFLHDQSSSYMTARSANQALQNMTQNLRRTTLPALPPVLGANGDVQYMEQLDLWKRWIQWERDDPLVLRDDDISAYKARVVFVYKQALMAMRFWPELWCDASEFCYANNMDDEGSSFLVQGLAANPESCLIAFKRADHLENTNTGDEGEESAKRRAAAVREVYDKNLNALYDLLNKLKAREERDVATVEAYFAQTSPLTNGLKKEEQDAGDSKQEENDGKKKLREPQIKSVEVSYAAQRQLLSRTISHVWIAVMRATRRIQGKQSFRDAFKAARARGRLTSDVYIAAALIEFHCYEPETAKKIFDRGLRLFPEDASFALTYIKHLVANNDHINARVAFETAVKTLEKKPETTSKARPLYAYFHEFESRYGELAQILKLEKRMRDLYPEDSALRLFSRRYIEQGFDPTAVRPIISPSQSRPKVISSIETAAHPSVLPSGATASTATVPPPAPLQVTNVNSPKRSLPLDDADSDLGRARKIPRAESPLKGAAGRRLEQQKRPLQSVEPTMAHQPPGPHFRPPPPLPREVMFLLSIIPKPETYQATKFKPSELVRLLRETNVPTNVSQLPPHIAQGGPPQPQAQPQHLGQPSMHNSPVHNSTASVPQQRPPMASMPQGQYGPYGNQFNGPYLYNR